MVVIATLHGIGRAGLVWGYAAPCFRNLQEAGYPGDRLRELHWRGAILGPLGYWLLSTAWGMVRAQWGLETLLAEHPTDPILLITHSAGCRIAWDWFRRRPGPAPVIGWVSCGANARILQGAAVPLARRRGVVDGGLPPWLHIVREGDRLGGPLGAFGARDRVLPRALLAEHQDYWTDPRVAQLIADEAPRP